MRPSAPDRFRIALNHPAARKQMTAFETLAQATYISIESYRGDGRALRTPVWITAEAGLLYCWTMDNSGKVKRIRNEARVKLAICDAAGKIQGEWVCASARVLDSAEDVQEQTRRMRAKFGLKFLLFRILAKLRGAGPVAIGFREACASP